MKKWQVSEACLDIIKKNCPFYATPIILNEGESDPSKHIYIGGYNFTKFVDYYLYAIDNSDTFSITTNLKLCEKTLNKQLMYLRRRFDTKLADKFTQNQIDAIASYLQSTWVLMDSPSSIISEFVKTQVYRNLKLEKNEKALNEIEKDVNYTFPNNYSAQIKTDNSRTELTSRRRKECKLFDTQVELKKSDLPDSNLFVLAKKMKNPKERKQFLKDFTSL